MKHIIISLFLLLASSTLFAKQSDWRVVQTVIVPSSTHIYEGVTKNGNPKYWIKIADNIEVSITKTNCDKLASGTAVIELVKWKNISTGKYRYSTRQRKPEVTITPDVDLSKVF